MIGRRAFGVFATLVLAGVLAACVTTRSSFPPPGSSPEPAGDSTAATVAQVIGALRIQSVPAVESTRPYRPAEGALLAAAPRSLVQATLPEDPDHGFIVVYAFDSPVAAQAAAQDGAGYLAAGIGGGIQNPPGTEYVLRVVGSNVVYFSWLPASSPDPRTASIATALATLGTGVQVPG
ncbi:MAG TPA: hypothetical protein VM451_11145 [Candidatus Limnocylindria bacterium]|nr:hypothetical protein [Candidatus Limnocylindria bacterium]